MEVEPLSHHFSVRAVDTTPTQLRGDSVGTILGSRGKVRRRIKGGRRRRLCLILKFIVMQP